MPWYRVNGTMMHIKLGGRRDRQPKPCAARIPLDGHSRTIGTTQRCCAISTFLCDWPTADGGTCDAPLCPEHAHPIGPDRHLCPLHERQRQENDALAPAESEPALSPQGRLL